MRVLPFLLSDGSYMSFRVLIDTGASRSDYISASAAAALVTHGHSLRDIVPFRACGAIGRRSSNSSGVEDVNSSCAIITSEVSVVLVLFKDHPGVNNSVRRRDFGFTPKILATIPIADMIIGYNT